MVDRERFGRRLKAKKLMIVLEEDKIEFEKDKLEYREANALFRHYSEIIWIVESIFFSVAFVIFGLSWKVIDSVMLSILAAASIGSSIFGFLTWTSQIFYAGVILKRIWELEKQMGLNLHLLIKSKDEEQALKSPILNSLKKLKYLTVNLLVFLVFLWALKIFIA
jgi:hypothetical protein